MLPMSFSLKQSSAAESGGTMGGSSYGFDSSGWTTATSGSRATGASAVPWYVWAGLGVLALLYVKKLK